jgi:hypothetical protein
MSDALGKSRETSTDLKGGFGGQYFSFSREEREGEEEETSEEPQEPQEPQGDRVVLCESLGRKSRKDKASPCPPAVSPALLAEAPLFPFESPPPEWENVYWKGGGPEEERCVPVERFRYLLDETVRLSDFVAARLADRRVDIVMERKILESLDRLGAVLRSTQISTLFPSFNDSLGRIRDGILDEIPALADATLKTFLRMLSTGDLREESYEQDGGMGFFFSSGRSYDLSGKIEEGFRHITAGLAALHARSDLFRSTGEPTS